MYVLKEHTLNKIMVKRLEITARLVDGSQLYWDVSTTVEALTLEEIDALRPKDFSSRELIDFDVRAAMHEKIREKFREAADRVWARAMERIR